MMSHRIILLGSLLSAATSGAIGVSSSAGQSDATIVLDMDTARHRPTTAGPDQRPIGTVEVVPGKFGSACKFSFLEGAKSGFFTAGVRPSPEWDRAAGLSFWVQGDGSSGWGGLELIDGVDYALRYGYCFPIESTGWQKVTVPWCDLVPELPAAGPVDPRHGYRPSKFGNLWFGYNGWDSGMRGEHFQKLLRFAVDRIRRMTKGESDVLLMTTCPAPGRWDTMEELAEAVRAVAQGKRTGLADVSAVFHQAGDDPPGRSSLYCRDKVHLGPAGHQLAAETVLGAIAETGRESENARRPKDLNARMPAERTPPLQPVARQRDAVRHPVPKEHPRLLGSRERLQLLARERAEAYQRVVRVARQQEADAHSKMVSMALVCAIEADESLGEKAVEMAMKTAGGPIQKGHVPFAHDLARCAIVYDLCHECWTPQQRAQFHEYVNKTVDANVRSETHVFHNGWYGYKNWGIGLACYAAYYENPRAPEILRSLEAETRTRAAGALELAGDGGGWAEGYYVNYWLYEWLFFCEAARWCEGIDYYATAPGFFRNRAVAGMFETYPGIGIYSSRRPIPMGDGGGRRFGGDRDKALSARRILADYFRDDPDHQAVHAFNETTPRSAVGNYAYKDFLWRDTTVKKADLGGFRLSHVSPGPGYVCARSSWDEDATYFFFKCGDRYTAHQHLDNGHFLIYKHEELAGDGGHYDDFGSEHDVNYHLRSIAHNTVLVHDPSETWPNIRAGKVTGNDGGQAHDWPHHNGAVTDADAWHQGRQLYDIADLVAFEDCGTYVYVAGDCTRAYSPKKLDGFTRQIVYGRPDTFIVFDRVGSRRPEFKKTWLLQAMKRPEGAPPNLVITNGKGRLFVQTLLPHDAQCRLVHGEELYSYGGRTYAPRRDTGAAPECRIEISPSKPARVDYFLHVLTAKDSSTDSVPKAAARETETEIRVTVGRAIVAFQKDGVGGYVEISGRRRPLPEKIVPDASIRQERMPRSR